MIPSETFRGRNPLAVASTTWVLGKGVLAGLGLMRELRPAAVIGFGGYPTIPPVAAAWLRRIPTLIHEQNAVLGRANKLLASGSAPSRRAFPACSTMTRGSP